MGIVVSSRKKVANIKWAQVNQSAAAGRPTHAEKIIVIHSWKQFAKYPEPFEKIGLKLFTNVLTQGSTYRKLWAMEEVTVKHIMKHPKVEHHGSVLRDEINKIINLWANVDDLTGDVALQRRAHKLGKLHHEIKTQGRQKDFSSRMWNAFPESLRITIPAYYDDTFKGKEMSTVLQKTTKAETLSAWVKFGTYLVWLLQEGYAEAKNGQGDMKSSIIGGSREEGMRSSSGSDTSKSAVLDMKLVRKNPKAMMKLTSIDQND